jgi:hypothetical protein
MMKITVKQLQKLVNEAVEKRMVTLNESSLYPSLDIKYPEYVTKTIEQSQRYEDMETLGYIADTYDKILKALKLVNDDMTPEMTLEEVITKYPGSFKSLMSDNYSKSMTKRALSDLKSGALSLEDMPQTGDEIIKIGQVRVKERHERWLAAQRKYEEDRAKMDPKVRAREDYEAEMRAVYGGDRNNQNYGLGT